MAKPSLLRASRRQELPVWEIDELEAISGELESLRRAVLEREAGEGSRLGQIGDCGRPGARNLLHYSELLAHDLESLRERLTVVGLAPPDRSPAHVLFTLESLRAAVRRLAGLPPPDEVAPTPVPAEVRKRCERQARALLGPRPEKRLRSLWVTLPELSDDDEDFVPELLAAGVEGLLVEAPADLAAWKRRIEGLDPAHGDPEARCRLVARLPGRRLCVGRMANGPAVLRWEPRRDELGRVMRPARLWLTPGDHPIAPLQPVDAVLPVSGKLLRLAQTEDEMRLRDTRGRRRELRIRGVGRSGCLAEADQTTYVEPGAQLRLERRGKLVGKGAVGILPPIAMPLRLAAGETLILTRDPAPGLPAERDGGLVLRPARISCTLPEVFGQVRAGDRILFDGGEIAGILETVSDDALQVGITHAGRGRARLDAGDSIHLPGSPLELPAFGPADDGALALAADHADAVVLRVERRDDVAWLNDALDRRCAGHLGVVLEVATRRGVEQLPRVLLAAMRHSPLGVLRAGRELMAEFGPAWPRRSAQIGRLARAAHLPVIDSAPGFDALGERRAAEAEWADALAVAGGDAVLLGPLAWWKLSAVSERHGPQRSATIGFVPSAPGW